MHRKREHLTGCQALPLEEYGYVLPKDDFRDAICLHYGWHINNLLAKCACRNQMTADHALVCHKGGYPSIQHNEIHNFAATLLSEVCSNTATEPTMQPLSGEDFHHQSANCEQEARADIRATGFWRERQDALFDVRAFHPDASSYISRSLGSIYCQNELGKKRSYGQRVRDVKWGAFTPLMVSSTGSIATARVYYFLQAPWYLDYQKKEDHSNM